MGKCDAFRQQGAPSVSWPCRSMQLAPGRPHDLLLLLLLLPLPLLLGGCWRIEFQEVDVVTGTGLPRECARRADRRFPSASSHIFFHPFSIAYRISTVRTRYCG